MRKKLRGKRHLAEFLWALIENFLLVFRLSVCFISSWEETYAQLCLMKLTPELIFPIFCSACRAPGEAGRAGASLHPLLLVHVDGHLDDDDLHQDHDLLPHRLHASLVCLLRLRLKGQSWPKSCDVLPKIVPKTFKCVAGSNPEQIQHL